MTEKVLAAATSAALRTPPKTALAFGSEPLNQVPPRPKKPRVQVQRRGNLAPIELFPPEQPSATAALNLTS